MEKLKRLNYTGEEINENIKNDRKHDADMVAHVTPADRKRWDSKPELSEVQRDREFKGSYETLEEIEATTPAEGDYYYCTADGHYYQWTLGDTNTLADLGTSCGNIDEMEKEIADTNAKVTTMFTDINVVNLWKHGNINSNTGEVIAEATNRVTTVDYIDSKIEFVETYETYEMLCHAWENDVYIGRWIGTGFSTDAEAKAEKLKFIDFSYMRKICPNYNFKIVISSSGNSYIDIGNFVANSKICVDNKHEKYVIKNLFNGIYSGAALLTYDDEPDYMTYARSEKSKVGIIPAEPNTTYYIKKFDTSDRTKIGVVEHLPKLGDTDIKTLLRDDDGTITSYTVTTGETDAFIMIQVSASGETPKLCVTKYQTNVFLPYDTYLNTNDIADDEISDRKTWSSKKICSSITNANYKDAWKIGNINSYTGEVIAEATSRARTDYLDIDNVKFLQVNNGRYELLCYAWENDVYIGRFTENGFSAAAEDTAVKVTELDVEELQQLYPTYRFKVVASTKTSEPIYDIDDLINSVLYVSNAPILSMVSKKMISDDEVSDEKTWSSKKINEKMKSVDDSGTKFYFLEDITGIYNCPDTVVGGSTADDVNLIETDAATIYEAYDELATAYPAYITKTVLGSVENYNICKYVFNYRMIENNSTFENKKIKIVINSGLHGYEQGAVWSLLQFLQLLCNTDKATDSIIKFIRHNVELVVIPIANPYGFSNNQRQNKNGVDINRNFDAGWTVTGEPGYEYYGGSEANSEAETQILSQFLKDNADANYVLDYHNIASGYPMYYINENSQARLCNSVFVALSNEWHNKYNGFPTDRLLGYCKTGSQGTFTRYAVKCGMRAMTLETPWTMPIIGSSQYDKNTIMTGVDVLANTLIAILKSYR
jgi:hypothetical protein